MIGSACSRRNQLCYELIFCCWYHNLKQTNDRNIKQNSSCLLVDLSFTYLYPTAHTNHTFFQHFKLSFLGDEAWRYPLVKEPFFDWRVPSFVYLWISQRWFALVSAWRILFRWPKFVLKTITFSIIWEVKTSWELSFHLFWAFMPKT